MVVVVGMSASNTVPRLIPGDASPTAGYLFYTVSSGVLQAQGVYRPRDCACLFGLHLSALGCVVCCVIGRLLPVALLKVETSINRLVAGGGNVVTIRDLKTLTCTAQFGAKEQVDAGLRHSWVAACCMGMCGTWCCCVVCWLHIQRHEQQPCGHPEKVQHTNNAGQHSTSC